MRLPTFARRDALKLLAAASLSWPALAQAQQPGGQPPAAPASPQPQSRFVYDDVVRRARDLAALPYEAPRNDLPASLTGMNFDQYRDLRFRPDRSLLQQGGGPFRMQMFHLGFIYRTPVVVNVIREGIATPIPYAAALFDYGRNRFERPLPVDLGFAGFRIHHPLNDPRVHDELISFLGASYFRFLGRGQKYGLSARGIAVNTAGPGQEEFPVFREFWVETPSAEAQSCQIYALLDGESLTGAFRFTVFPAQETVLDVHCTLFPRRAIPKLGVAPLTSMFFYAENDRRFFDDYRPELHDSDGLLIHSDTGEWLWRPLRNPRQVEVSQFADRQVRGFGLMQRDRQWSSYEDVEARYERRPSAWVRPLHDWGAGRVELVQLNTPDETHDNIVAYWVPAQMPAPGQPLEFAYELSWQGDEQQRPPGAWATQSRRGMGYTKLSAQALRQQVQYVVDFEGPALKALPAEASLKAVVTSDANGKVLESITYRNPATGGWRMTVRIQRLQADRPIELRAFLQHDNHAVSETWTHISLPE